VMDLSEVGYLTSPMTLSVNAIAIEGNALALAETLSPRCYHARTPREPVPKVRLSPAYLSGVFMKPRRQDLCRRGSGVSTG
jgi:hypothetical protein